MSKKDKVGIVLEGGGAKGAYQLGAWKAISDLGIQYNGVVGTSIGAINAAAMILGDYKKIIKIWKGINFKKLFFSLENKNEDYFKIKKIDFSEIRKDIDAFYYKYINSKGLETKSMLKLIKQNIDEDFIRNSEKDFGLTTYCLSDKKPLELFKEDIPKGMIPEYILASCYLPIFNPEVINGKYYLDGGFFNNLPINMLVDKGYNKIITIRLKPDKYDFSKYKNVKIIDISPNEFLCGTLELDRKKSKFIIKKGYEDALKILS